MGMLTDFTVVCITDVLTAVCFTVDIVAILVGVVASPFHFLNKI